MARPRLLILDACTVIELHEIGLWAAITKSFEVTLTETVQVEAGFYESGGEMLPITLGADVQVVSVSASAVAAFRARFGPTYLGQMHDGETESLVQLFTTTEGVICSSDAIVYKILGCLGQTDRCVSLEKLLEKAGMGRKMRSFWCKESYREACLKEGFEDQQYGRALKK